MPIASISVLIFIIWLLVPPFFFFSFLFVSFFCVHIVNGFHAFSLLICARLQQPLQNALCFFVQNDHLRHLVLWLFVSTLLTVSTSRISLIVFFPFADFTLAELRQLDIAYNYTPDHGLSYPMRGQGIHYMTLPEFLQRFQGRNINLEIKSDGPEEATKVAEALLEIPQEDTDKVVVASR